MSETTRRSGTPGLTLCFTLQTLRLSLSVTYAFVADDAETIGSALRQLLEANNVPALACLDASDFGLGDAGLEQLVDALQSNTRLRELHLRGNRMSSGFLRCRLLPALRTNSGLRTVTVDERYSAAVCRTLASRGR